MLIRLLGRQGMAQMCTGTNYSNWLLARSRSQNHQVTHNGRLYPKDRYSIHKLTNVDFMCKVAKEYLSYELLLNENIMLLSQMNHVFNVLRRSKHEYVEFRLLIDRVVAQIDDPSDLICMGTFMHALTCLGRFDEHLWLKLTDTVLSRKHDEQYDELFGIMLGYKRYAQRIEETSDYAEKISNQVLPLIPVIYRRQLELVRQYIRFNVYNFKEVRLILRFLSDFSVNERYFWESIELWFTIHIKESIQAKQLDEFFILNEEGIELMLFDDGIVRTRGALEELTEVAYYLAAKGFRVTRFVQFAEQLILFAIENGSNIYSRFSQSETHKKQQKDKERSINEHLRLKSEDEKENVKKMEKQYTKVFINPIELKNQSIIQFLVILKNFCFQMTTNNEKSKEQTENSSNNLLFEPSKKRNSSQAVDLIDRRVLKWLVLRLCRPEMQYTISQLIQVLKCKSFLSFSGLDLVQFICDNLLRLRDSKCTYQELEKLLKWLPLDRFSRLMPAMLSFLSYTHPSDILKLTKLIISESMNEIDFNVQQQMIRLYPNETIPESERISRFKRSEESWLLRLTEYFIELPNIVNYHNRYYSFDENCYFLYVLLKHQPHWVQSSQPSIPRYYAELEQLKEGLKVTTYTRGFKMQPGTNFHKLLDYIDMADFFEGGNLR